VRTGTRTGADDPTAPARGKGIANERPRSGGHLSSHSRRTRDYP
jgi:hypothetical protein